jgi:hypothetical protein
LLALLILVPIPPWQVMTVATAAASFATFLGSNSWAQSVSSKLVREWLAAAAGRMDKTTTQQQP